MAKGGKSFTDSLIEAFAGKTAETAAGLILSVLVGGGLWSGTISTGFYHEGWWEQYRSWAFLFIAIFLVATAAAITRRGFWVVGVLTLTASLGFAVVYGQPGFQSGNWPLIGWHLHGISIALGLAFMVGLVGRIWRALVPGRP